MDNITYFYPQREEAALKEVNLAVEEGELVLVMGESGSGKSTLLRVIAGIIPEFYGGKYQGEVYIDGKKLRSMKNRERAGKIGFLFQNPENQLFTSRVEKELVFAMENLGLAKEEMQKRVAETADFFGLSSCLKSRVAELSGGMKQKLALASLAALKPEILVLDEPLSQLDPKAAEEILNLVLRLNQEYGITVIMAEQRLDRCLPLADRIIVMEKGKIVYDEGEGKGERGLFLREKEGLLPSLPRIFARLGEKELPFTVKEARKWINKLDDGIDMGMGNVRDKAGENSKSENLLAVKGVWFSYSGKEEVLRSMDFTVQEGDIWAVMGENGAGKTTLLKVMAGILPPSQGRVFYRGQDVRLMKQGEIARRVSLVPQNPDDYFFLPTVREEVEFNLKQAKREEKGEEILAEFQLLPYAECNPRDLSMGEKQRLLLAAVCALNPEVILLDEPTRGLDYQAKEELGSWLKRWSREGKGIVMVSHDVEFAAEYGDRALLLFNGEIAAKGSKYEVMEGALFYSPPVNRLFAGKVPYVLTGEEGYQVLRRLKERWEKGRANMEEKGANLA